MTSNEVRKKFFDFFQEKNHKYVKSSKIFLEEDSSLLFVNAGMNQFKKIFLGQSAIEYPRVVGTQKCLRVSGKHNDLDEVGFDHYHHTFFEMLGSWSFSDYGKKESIEWAWELLTKEYQLLPEKLYATVFEQDNDALELWKQYTLIDHKHILKFGKKNNFWEMGTIGPCGPCTEIHYDFGVGSCSLEGKSDHVCGVNQDHCERYIELWNIVFMEHQRLEDGSLKALSHQFIDTGMGLERIVRVLQQKNSNYETDLFFPLIEHLEKESGLKYQQVDQQMQGAFCVIADHIRALVFAIGDGVIPSNTSRGYVLRRILRRAIRYGKKLGCHRPFLVSLAQKLIQIMSSFFSELKQQEPFILEYLQIEEHKFQETLDKGLLLFEKETQFLLKGDVISGKMAFTLFDTFGFPIDLTVLLAREKGFLVDLDEFEKHMNQQRELAKNNQKFQQQSVEKEFICLDPENTETQFLGYEIYEADECQIVSYRLLENQRIEIILNKTPFYAESGGQVADHGVIQSNHFIIEVDDVQKSNNQFVHFGKIIEGSFQEKDLVSCQINVERRESLMRHHSGTHLLHIVLKELFDKNLEYNSTYVDESAFICEVPLNKLSSEQIMNIEKKMNQYSLSCLPVTTTIENREAAIDRGIKGKFESKYKDVVRIVSMGDLGNDFCGGTHVSNTGQLGMFKILSDVSAGTNLRRLECVSGLKTWKNFFDLHEQCKTITQTLKIPISQISEKVFSLLEDIKDLKKENKELMIKTQKDLSPDDLEYLADYQKIPFYLGIFQNAGVPSLQKLSKFVIENDPSKILLVLSETPSYNYQLTMSQETFNKGIFLKDIHPLLEFLISAKGGGKDLQITGGYKIQMTKMIKEQLKDMLINQNSDEE